MIGLTLNHRGNICTQANLYGFEGMARAGDYVLGANTDGLFVVGETDDDSPTIDAFFDLTFDMGRPCRLRFVWITGEFSGPMCLTLWPDEQDIGTVHNFTPRQISNRQHAHKIPVRRDSGHGRYWRLRIANVDGSDFGVDNISVQPVFGAGQR